MALSEATIAQIFPQGEPAFSPPFHVETDDGGEVHIHDSNNMCLTTFCRYTQIPISDERAIAAEVAYWQAEAGRLIAALNASYPQSS